VSTVFETTTGFITSPNPVAVKAGSYMLSPTGAFSNGYQDFNNSAGLHNHHAATHHDVAAAAGGESDRVGAGPAQWSLGSLGGGR
jgi:hypothetical protein